jgi:DNA-dependent RNA polymerase auxiliary subunit epsilon
MAHYVCYCFAFIIAMIQTTTTFVCAQTTPPPTTTTDMDHRYTNAQLIEIRHSRNSRNALMNDLQERIHELTEQYNNPALDRLQESLDDVRQRLHDNNQHVELIVTTSDEHIMRQYGLDESTIQTLLRMDNDEDFCSADDEHE